ncbi:MAG: SusD/RagB family nutrient-binding outer membrane lipoprotein [Bacteroidetes bacterium]|uniref:SusD/RagB family nutrient-binding outer membrane lipoprotein n=1 Tax=Candidatus Cryptobacteroides merdavium TaxID=2840769 RepID=A0A9D9EBK9_9BACT|nr:SusD/RagB family nutrient-binding outer membrane lipoprotein [Candidatus Cryptobacteroides merdavium]
MKINSIIKTGSIAVAFILAASACTKDFEYFNTNPDAVQEVDVKSYITTMEMDAVIPCSDVGANEFQRACNLMGDAFAGYLSPCQQFNGGNFTCTYDLNGTDYNNVPFSVAFTSVMPAWLNLKYAYDNGQISEEFFAVAEVIKVMCLQRTTDIYGPIPVSHFGEDVNPYDSQEQVYMDLFEDLDNAISILSNYTSVTSTALGKVDAVYEGDLSKWYKLANSQKLRMAMRVRYVVPDFAKTCAEEAVAAGVMESSDDGAWLETSGSITVQNPLEVVWNMYGDTRMGATMDCYLNGYSDPRLSAYFQQATIDEGGYHGIRSGIANMQPDDDPNYTCLSAPNVQATTPVVWFLASEVAFLRAEGAMIGWNMGAGDEQSFYENGIALSFEENGLSASAAAAYYTDNDSAPIAFDDCSQNSTKYSYGQPSTITPSWDSSASDEVKLERIITQKWIAMYPNGQEAWSEFRRTGYPKVIPIYDNRSGGTVSTDEQVRRMTFPRSEYSNNSAQVQAAISLLEGGSDTGGTKLWWDKK